MKKIFAAQAWVIWLLVMAIITLLTRNPFYLLILLLITRIVEASCRTVERSLTIRFWRVALIIILFSIILNFLMVHIGETVVASLPDDIWMVGGDLTLEAAVYGTINGLLLVTLLAIFLTFNAVVPVNELVRLTPRAFANVGLVVVIALTYVPETMEQIKRIKEAQAVRGHRLKGLRDWQPIIIPLLIGGLERSMSLAETMVARGYGATTEVKQSTTMRVALLITLIFTLIGWIMTFWNRWLGWSLVLTSIVLIGGVVVYLGRKVKHSRYRPRYWDKWDLIMVINAIVPFLLIIFPVPFIDNTTIFFTPYPQVQLPTFDFTLGLALALLVTPAVIVELFSKETVVQLSPGEAR